MGADYADWTEGERRESIATAVAFPRDLKPWEVLGVSLSQTTPQTCLTSPWSRVNGC